jgi:transcriptional regulator with XRE-family HTH domain
MALKDFLKSNSIADKDWRRKAEYRKENKGWLDVSFSIALKILKFLKENNISQKELAERLGCSPQYVSKIVKGKENLTLETIWKIEKELGEKLIFVSTGGGLREQSGPASAPSAVGRSEQLKAFADYAQKKCGRMVIKTYLNL